MCQSNSFGSWVWDIASFIPRDGALRRRRRRRSAHRPGALRRPGRMSSMPMPRAYAGHGRRAHPRMPRSSADAAAQIRLCCRTMRASRAPRPPPPLVLLILPGRRPRPAPRPSFRLSVISQISSLSPTTSAPSVCVRVGGPLSFFATYKQLQLSSNLRVFKLLTLSTSQSI